MKNERKRGRPKKANAKKPGELNKGLCRFNFIADEKIVEKIKKEAKKKRISIKALMSYILNYYFNKGSKENEIDNKLLSIEYLTALIMADIDASLLQNKEQTEDLDKMYDKDDVRAQLHYTSYKIIKVLLQAGYDIKKPLQVSNSFINQ